MSGPLAPSRPDCPEEERLSGLLEGEVDPVERQFLEGHLEVCPRCRQALGELRSLRDGLGQLRGVEVPPALFAQVTGAVRRQRRCAFWMGTGIVGGLCGAALAAGLLLASRVAVPVEIPLDRPLSLRASAQAELHKAEHHFRNAIQMLEVLVAEEKSRWTPSRRAAFEADVQVLGQAVQESRHLASRAPEDAALQELLFSSYRAQLDYLREVLASRSNDAI